MSVLKNVVVLTLILIGSFVDAIVYSATSNVAISPRIEQACYRGSIEDVVDMVNRAEKLIDEVGSELAFRQFMVAEGGFIRGDLYVFAIDQQGTIVANGAAPISVGRNSLQARDQTGYYFVKDMLVRASRSGSGWVRYQWFSPCTGKMSMKRVYFKRLGHHVVGVGSYSPLDI
ncbi:MAG: cytochrome c [Gammaproteobacteria bacterium]|jgi:cytochrome c